MKKNYMQLFSAKELAVLFKTDIYKMCKKLKSLEKFGFIETKNIDKKIAYKIYGQDYKRPILLYTYKE
ncbi:MAG: hypothetical protein ACOCUD_01735 [Bacillota bacterium]